MVSHPSGVEGIGMEVKGGAVIDDLLASVQEAEVLEVTIGLNWTAVVVETPSGPRCGLASTLAGDHSHGGPPRVPGAGSLEGLGARRLAELARERDRETLASVGMAAINALLPVPPPQAWREINAEEVILEHGQAGPVALIGHFPFVPRLHTQLQEFYVLDLDPQPGDLPAEAATHVLPKCNLVAITSMTLANHTLEGLLGLCAPEAMVMLLGPSTPLSPVLFEHGVDLLSGAVVEQIEPVLRAVRQGGNFRQVHEAGVKLITLHGAG
jgi:uncharacterized protein (DUF4213/DUF364 family)